MRKILPLFIFVFLLATPALADWSDFQIPDDVQSRQALIYNAIDDDFDYATTIGLVTYKDVALQGGYAVNNTAILALTYKLEGLKKLGANIPIAGKFLDPAIGVYGGLSRINASNEWSSGIIVV